MLRRTWLAAPFVFIAGCGRIEEWSMPPSPGSRPDALVSLPAQRLALVLADMPVGFDVGQELVSVTPTGAMDPPDPFGRLSAYAVTFRAPGNRGHAGDVVSSVNAYVGMTEAKAAFASWQAAVPNNYRLAEAPPPGAPPGSAAYVQAADGSCLLGFRSHNVIASVRVGPTAVPLQVIPKGGAGDAGTPVAQAVRLAALVLHRIDAGVGAGR
jgi:hypothetical protein